MTTLIDNFIDQNQKIAAFLSAISKEYENADERMHVFKAFITETNYNAALGIDLAILLQCLDAKEHLQEFQLTDISKLFESLLQLEPSNIDIYLEAAHFEWAVMDNREKALEYVKKGIEITSTKTKKLQQLLDTIENND